MNKTVSEAFQWLVIVLMAALLVLSLIGYVLGAVKLVKSDFEAPYKGEILYAIGIPTGLNSIFGWMDFE